MALRRSHSLGGEGGLFYHPGKKPGDHLEGCGESFFSATASPGGAADVCPADVNSKKLPRPMARGAFYCQELAAATAAAVSTRPVGREELVDGELHVTEDLTGILLAGAAVAGAFLLRHAVVIDRDEQLGVPLQADEGELAKRDVEPLALAAEVQIAAEAGTDAGGHVAELAALAVAVAGIHQLHAQSQGIHRLH